MCLTQLCHISNTLLIQLLKSTSKYFTFKGIDRNKIVEKGYIFILSVDTLNLHISFITLKFRNRETENISYVKLLQEVWHGKEDEDQQKFHNKFTFS